MEIEIVGIGMPGRWVLSQPQIRVGQDVQCEVCLRNLQPGEPLLLEQANGTLRLGNVQNQRDGVFLNDNPAGEGYLVRSGDVLRLGTSGPALSIRVTGTESPAAPPMGYSPTLVLDEPLQRQNQATVTDYSAASQPTQKFAAQPVPQAAPQSAQQPAPRASGRYGYETESVQSVGFSAAPQRLITPQRPANAPGRPENTPTTAPPSPDTEEALRLLERKLKNITVILCANLAVLAVLLVLVFQLSQQAAQTQQDLQALRTQAQSAVAQFTPTLDSRLEIFERRLDGLDGKLKSAEDHLVSRVNADVPPMLDKYIHEKLAEVKH